MNFVKNLISKLNKKHLSTKIIAGIFTVAIITLLILAGPAKAFILGLTIDEPEPDKGEKITFTASVKIQSNDKYLPVKELTLVLDGPETRTCVFDVSGNIISGCDGIENIERISVPNSGLGYGYGYYNGYGYDFGYDYGYNANGINELKYEITLNTLDFETGTYSTELKALIGDKVFSESGPDLIIGIHFADENGDGNIDMPELMDTIGRWKADSSDVTMPELMGTICRWKHGQGNWEACLI